MGANKLLLSTALLACVAGAAAQDECLDVKNVCPLKQTCKDADTATPDNWICECDAPASGVSMGPGAAACTLDECAVNCPTCENGLCGQNNQDCIDLNKKADELHDWVCSCRSPALASFSYASAATCVLNECTLHSSVCNPVAQTCVDPNVAANSTGDWVCECNPPLVGSGQQGIASCIYDECKENFALCTGAGQTCLDPNTSSDSVRDWKCQCVAPATGEQVRGIAECTYTDECAANSATCNGPGQHCVDPDAAMVGDWRCECFAPFTGMPMTGASTTCELDECTSDCASCAKTTGGDQCSDVGQLCKDLDKSALSLRDWECSCIDPQSGASRPMGAAACVLNECAQNAATCVNGQTCEDPDPSPNASGDWKCVCPKPAVGEAVAKAATCVYDECLAFAADQCVVAGQECADPKKTRASVDDWECRCVAPATGSQVAGVATCTYPAGDECEKNSTVCTSKGQKCTDPSTSTTDDWQCECIPPAEGRAVTGAATECIIDECTAVCATCADTGSGNVCSQSHQACMDPDKHPSSPHDWVCICPASRKNKTGGPALCVDDECTRVGCGVNQTCIDPDTTEGSIGDYYCECTYGKGKQVGAPANCAIDECKYHSTACSTQFQSCYDPDPLKEGDWFCECPAPATGTQVGGPVLVCDQVDDCVTGVYVCQQYEQTCIDTNGMNNDYSCACISPRTGPPMKNGEAKCDLDECVQQCDTCATSPHSAGAGFGNVCTDKGQICHDPDHSPKATGDWKCECAPPSVGTPGVTVAAVCELDECLTPSNNASCGEHQQCNDINRATTSVGDWACECIMPWVGQQVTGPASCRLTPTPAPDTPAPPTPAPPTATPTTAPATPAPDTVAPDTLAPTPAPPTPAPDTPAPMTPAPDTPVPTNPPDTPAPPTPAPPTPAPSTPAPDTPAPLPPGKTLAPDTTAPETPLPPGATFAPPTPLPPGMTLAPTAMGTDAPATPLPAGATFAPPTPLPAGATLAPTTAPETPLPAGATFAPDTPLPPGMTLAPPTAATTDAPATPLPAGETFAPPTPLPAGATLAPTSVPETPLPAGETFAPPTPLPPDMTLAPTVAAVTDAPATPLPPGVTFAPTTPLPPGLTFVPSTPLPAGSAVTPLPPGVTFAPSTPLPAGSTFAPATPLPPGTTFAPPTPATPLPPGATFAPATPLPAGSTFAPPTPMPPGMTTAPATQLSVGVTQNPTAAECAQKGVQSACVSRPGCDWNGVSCIFLGAGGWETPVPTEEEDDTLIILLLIVLFLLLLCLVLTCIYAWLSRKKDKYHERNEVSKKDTELQKVDAESRAKSQVLEGEEALLQEYRNELDRKNQELEQRAEEVNEAKRETEAERDHRLETEAELDRQAEKQRQMLEARDADERLRQQELLASAQRDSITKAGRSPGFFSVSPGLAGSTAAGFSTVRQPSESPVRSDAPPSRAGPMPPQPPPTSSPVHPESVEARRPPIGQLPTDNPSTRRLITDDPVALAPQGSPLRTTGYPSLPHPTIQHTEGLPPQGVPGALPPSPPQ